MRRAMLIQISALTRGSLMAVAAVGANTSQKSSSPIRSGIEQRQVLRRQFGGLAVRIEFLCMCPVPPRAVEVALQLAENPALQQRLRVSRVEGDRLFDIGPGLVQHL